MAPDEWDDDPDEGEYEDEFDCHMTRDGSCGAAGSEDCEFECPYRAEQRERAMRKRAPAEMPLFPGSA